MSSLWKHPKSPYWTACYTNKDGKQVKRSTKSTSRKEATKIALEWEALETQARAKTLTTVQVQKVMNELVADVTGDSIHVPTVEKYFADWIEAKRNRNAPRTVERYETTSKQFLKCLGEQAKRPITGLAPRHIEEFLDHRLKHGAAPKTAAVDIKILNTALNRAERYGLILKNPTLAVELPKGESSVRDTFSGEQVAKLFFAAPTEDWKTLILLGYYTGARLGDCVHMTWENVDMLRKCIVYRQRKTGKEVVIPIHYDLFVRLDFLAEFHQTGFLCPELAAKTPGGKHGLSEGFKRIVVRAGIAQCEVQGQGARKFNKLTFHSLRHSFNSELANKGVSQELRVKLTGHSSFAMNDRYTQFGMSPLSDAVAKLPSTVEER